MREFYFEIPISASAEEIWRVLTDVEHWPEWTPSVSRVEPLGAPPLVWGSRVRIYQPKLRPAIWQVTHWEPKCRFAWVTKQPGVTVVADHTIKTNSSGCSVVLGVRFNGVLAALVGFLSRRLVTRNLEIEASGLKARSEALA
jgi:hypothetical protein